MNSSDDTVLVLVDVQGRLAEIMHEKEALFDNLQRLIKGMQALKVPILWLEQIPEKMGPTIPPLAALLTGEQPIRKTSFSACGNDIFMKRLHSLGRKRVVVAGIETHVCIYQTAKDLVERDYEVDVVADAVSSRSAANKQVALTAIQDAGARLTSTEMILFELMQTAEHPAFREMLRIIK